MGGYTTYASITKKTMQEEEGVASPAAARSVAARLVGILMGAVVLVTLSNTTDPRGIGGSMVSLRSSDTAAEMIPGGGKQTQPESSGGHVSTRPFLVPPEIPDWPGVATPATMLVEEPEQDCHTMFGCFACMFSGEGTLFTNCA